METLTLYQKWSTLQESIYRALMDSEYLETLQNAKDEEEFEHACAALAFDVMVFLGEGDVEPWTVEDRRQLQIQTLEQDIARNQTRLDELKSRVNK
jgi:hypothetical protein